MKMFFFFKQNVSILSSDKIDEKSLTEFEWFMDYILTVQVSFRGVSKHIWDAVILYG